MSDEFEDRLRTHLAERASRFTVEPDPDGLIHRSAGPRRRRGTVLAAAALASFLAGAGVLTGVNLAGAGPPVASGQSPSPSPSRHLGDLAGPAVRPGSSTPSLPGAAGQLPLTPLFTRTSSSGVAIRVYTMGQEGPSCSPAGTCPPTGTGPGPAPCPTGALCAQPMIGPPATGCGQLVIELSTDKAVAIGAAPESTSGPPSPGGLAVLGSGSFGVAEGAAVSWVAVRAGSGVGAVDLSSGNNVTSGPPVTDGMAPSSGIAVLAQPGAGLTGADVVGVDQHGATVATVPADQAGGGATCSNPATPPTTTTTTAAPPTTTAPPPTTTPTTQPATPTPSVTPGVRTSVRSTR